MTCDELQAKVRVLANGSWCRYWVHYDRTDTGQSIMAIQCRDEHGKPVPISDAQRHGFKVIGDYFYIVPRTNADGSQWLSKDGFVHD